MPIGSSAEKGTEVTTTHGKTADIRIRPGEVEDAEAMHGAIQAMGRGLDMVGKVTCTVEDFSRFGFGAAAAFGSLIAEVDREFAGLCLFFPIFSTWRGRPGVFVQDLYVGDRFRGLGIASACCAKWPRGRGRGAGTTCGWKSMWRTSRRSAFTSGSALPGRRKTALMPPMARPLWLSPRD